MDDRSTAAAAAQAPAPEPTRADRFATWWIGGPLGLILGLIALAQLATWIPHYLTWPYWADHDVFANIARSWTRGDAPYRDNRLNNFPGTVYLFVILGKLGGWGRPSALYGFDACLVVAFGAGLVLWSRRTSGRAAPGWIGYLAFLSYYLGLDYAHAAQRDWHAPGLAILGLLLAQGWPGGWSRVASAALMALALSVRPQAVLFLPALVAAVGWSRPGTPGDRIGRVVAWGLTLAVGAWLAFLPLILAGLFGDFLDSLRLVRYGSAYNKVGPASIARAWVLQAASWKWWVVPAAIALIGSRAGPARRAAALPWLLALAGASWYKPVSPVAHTYLDIPLMVAWSATLAVLAGRILGAEGVSPAFRLAGVVGLLGMGTTTLRPEFSIVGPNLRAPAVLRSGDLPEEAPPGYRKGTVGTSAFYPWKDYRDTLVYLKGHTGPTTRVANVLLGDPAIVSAVDRPSAFPAEAITWLRIGRPSDEADFAARLEAADDSVVVWIPDEVGLDPRFRIDLLKDAIRRLYRFEARFGRIEVWRRAGG